MGIGFNWFKKYKLVKGDIESWICWYNYFKEKS